MSLPDCGAKRVLSACKVEGDLLISEAIKRLTEGKELENK